MKSVDELAKEYAHSIWVQYPEHLVVRSENIRLTIEYFKAGYEASQVRRDNTEVHSCHNDCQRVACVLTRENQKLKERVGRLEVAIEQAIFGMSHEHDHDFEDNEQGKAEEYCNCDGCIVIALNKPLQRDGGAE